MKSITIAGNIGKDAATRNAGGTPVTGWSVAVEERNGQDKRTLWFDCSLWGTRGEKLAQYLSKGTRVAVSGDLSTREHEGKTYLTIRAEQVTLLGGGQSEARPRDEAKPQGGGRSLQDDLADEIPF